MRQVGIFEGDEDSKQFSDYLIHEHIEHERSQNRSGQWDIWIVDDDVFAKAKDAFVLFSESPEDGRFQTSPEKVQALRDASKKTPKKRVAVVRDREQSQSRTTPITLLLLAACVILYMMQASLIETGMSEGPNPKMVTIADPVRDQLSFRLDVFNTFQFWRVFTPALMHDQNGFFHLLFNMLWLVNLGPRVEARKGAWGFIVFLLLLAGGSNVVQGVLGSPHFLGLSGVVYGLFGYLWMLQRHDPKSSRLVEDSTVLILLVWYSACLVTSSH